ncbi:MAG: outer membrane lipoprotein carrier protein LolA [Devosia sp.]
MHRRSLLALIAASAALGASGARAQDAPPPPADLTAEDLLSGAPRALTAEETQLINDISTHNSAITTMQGKFLQIDRSGGRIEGVFFLQRPDKIRFKYNPPSREEIISAGRGFYVLDRKEKKKTVYPQENVPLRQFLTDRIDLLNAGLIAINNSPNYVALTLQDETPIGTVRVDLAFDRASMDLVQWVLTDPQGTELTFSIYDVEKNIEIPRTYFYIDPTFTTSG